MKLLLSCLLVGITFANAEPPKERDKLTGKNGTGRDGSGRITGTASESNGITTYRDGSGQITGTASRSGDTITFRDASGRITGTASAK